MKRRIAIVCPASPNLPGGGHVGCLEIARQLERMGHEIILLVVSREPIPSLTGFLGPVVTIAPSRLHYLLDGIAVAYAVIRLAADQSLDAVFAWGTEAAFLLRPLRARRIPLCIIAAKPSYCRWRARRSPLRGVTKIVDNFFLVRPLRHCHRVFALSEFTRRELLDLFHLAPEKVVVAHWAVDPIFACVSRVPSLEISRLLFFGSLDPLKGVFDALRAFALFHSRTNSSAQFRIAGWGNTSSVHRCAAELDITDSVHFLGAIDRKALLYELEWAHLALLPSHSESFGLAIAEAQAAALPVVSYFAGSIPEVVEDGVTAWLVPAGDVEALATALTVASTNPAAAYGRGLAGRKRILHRFSWSQTVITMLSALENRPPIRSKSFGEPVCSPLVRRAGSGGSP